MAKKKAIVKKEAGRPTKYKSEYPEQTFKLCLLGATDKEIANIFEVNEDMNGRKSTLNFPSP
jgi:hypothetical protein